MNPVASSSNGMALGFSDGTNNNRLFFQRLTNADPVAARAVTSAGGSASGKATAGANVTIGQWGHWCGLFPSVASRTIFFNGTDKQTDSTGLGAQAALTTFYVAAAGTGAASSQRAIFAEIGVWNAILTDDEVALLGASKYAPSLVRPDALVAYWKLDGSGSTELDSAGSNNMTITGTVPAASHPDGILYAIPSATTPEVGAPTISGPGRVAGGGRRRERLARADKQTETPSRGRRYDAPKGRKELRRGGESPTGETSRQLASGPQRSEGMPTDGVVAEVTTRPAVAFDAAPLIATADALIAQRLVEQERIATRIAQQQAQEAARAALLQDDEEALTAILAAVN